MLRNFSFLLVTPRSELMCKATIENSICTCHAPLQFPGEKKMLSNKKFIRRWRRRRGNKRDWWRWLMQKNLGGKARRRERKKEDYFGGEGWKFNIQYLERKMAVSELSFKFNVNCRRKIICLRCRCWRCGKQKQFKLNLKTALAGYQVLATTWTFLLDNYCIFCLFLNSCLRTQKIIYNKTILLIL